MDLAISDARLPGAIRPHTDSYYLPEDAVSRSVIPTFAQARLNDAVTEVQNAFLLTTLALRAYRLEHGQYPPYLAQLVPRYLKAVPLDSFTPPYSYRSQTLQYRRTGQTYKLYSFGPDGRDNGGVPIQDRNRPRDKGRYLIEWGSTGDIVAGINQH